VPLKSFQRVAAVVLPLAALMFTFGSALQAQPGAILRTHTTEVGGFIGASYGVDKARVMGGGNVAFSVTRELMPFAEVSYFPGIGRTATVTGIDLANSKYSLPIQDVNFGLHFRVPIPKSRVIPYGVISFGLIHNSEHTETITYPDTLRPGQMATLQLQVPAATNFATSFGGGIRVYATERLGFRGEFKGYKPSGGDVKLDAFYRVTGGIFFQF
jgi:hypothetical protein